MADIVLTEKQQDAVDMALALAASGCKVGVLSGVGGSGKTSALRKITDTIQCQLISPTGKAATRMTELTGKPASTVHRWLYEPDETLSGHVTFTRRPIEKIAVPSGKLIVVDEASMVNEEMFRDLLDTSVAIGCALLFVGDPFQLPPVSKDRMATFSIFSEDFKYDAKVELTEIMRQAANNPIIKLCSLIRAGEVADAMESADLVWGEDVLPRLISVIDSGGMVLTHSNKARLHMNKVYRHHKGLTELVKDEPLLVLKNCYRLGVMNGETVAFTGHGDFLGEKSVYCPINKKEVKMSFFMTQIAGMDCIMSQEVIEGKHQDVSISSIERVLNYWVRDGVPYVHVNYGYALSTHKSQGSEANQVLVCIEPSIDLFSHEGQRWAYTAFSRAVERVSVTYLSRNPEQDFPLTPAIE